MHQKMIIERRIDKLEKLAIEETLRNKIDYLFLDLLKTRIKQEQTKLSLLKIGQ